MGVALGALAMSVGATTAGTVSTAGATDPGAIAAAAAARMTIYQRVGQLFMVGGAATGVSSTTTALVNAYHVGGVILTGRNYSGVAAVAHVTASLRARVSAASSAGAGLLVAADQEGGYVQALGGPLFSTIPTALTQGTWSTSRLRYAGMIWGNQLRAAGANVDLAPVADTVPGASFAPRNLPIGYWQREFGFTTATVASHAAAFIQGMAAAGVEATAKHFPGLGRVTANPDVSSGVTDHVTTAGDPFLSPFAAAITAGVPLVMVSTAFYSQIDALRPAAFSRTVVSGVLRGDLGFAGVVISDDLGSARQVAAWSPGARAANFIGAGGDIVLTVAPAVLPAMYDAVLHLASVDASFRARVNQAAVRVLTLKARLGLVR